MELTIVDRITLLGIAPKNVGLVSGKLWRDIIEKVEFSIEEIGEYELGDKPGGGIKWNVSKAKTKKVDLSKEQLTELSSLIDELDKKKAIPFPQGLDLALKIKDVV